MGKSDHWRYYFSGSWRLYLAGIIVLLVTVVSSCSSMPNSPGQATPGPAELKAAIIDQIDDIQPNEALINGIERTLADYGFKTVDIFQGKAVDINLYLQLPQQGYKLIILRTHSGLLYENGDIYQGSWLFTNEICQQDLNHADQRLNKKIAKARIDDAHPWVYAIGSQFISESMRGNFNNCFIIAMGCYSFMRDDLAKAFIGKGAAIYLGWDNLVNLDYTDMATENLIKNLCEKNEPLSAAMINTFKVLGPEPDHQSRLEVFPDLNTDKTLNNIIK
jgi:hypothetical protein